MLYWELRLWVVCFFINFSFNQSHLFSFLAFDQFHQKSGVIVQKKNLFLTIEFSF